MIDKRDLRRQNCGHGNDLLRAMSVTEGGTNALRSIGAKFACIKGTGRFELTILRTDPFQAKLLMGDPFLGQRREIPQPRKGCDGSAQTRAGVHRPFLRVAGSNNPLLPRVARHADDPVGVEEHPSTEN